MPAREIPSISIQQRAMRADQRMGLGTVSGRAESARRTPPPAAQLGQRVEPVTAGPGSYGYYTCPADLPLASNTADYAAWDLNSGDTIFDLTDPTTPTVLADGMLAIAVDVVLVGFPNDPAIACFMQYSVYVSASFANAGGQGFAWQDVPKMGGTEALWSDTAFTFKATAGDTIRLYARRLADGIGSDANFRWGMGAALI